MTALNEIPSISRRGLLVLGGSATMASLGHAATALAQAGAVRRLIVGFPPGGIADRLARLVADALERASSSSFIVESRPGAGGLIAAEFVARNEGDGKLLLLGNVDSLALERVLRAEAGFDAWNNLTIVAGVARFAYFLVANASLQLHNLQDLIAVGRRSTKGISYVDFGSGSRLTFEVLRKKFGLNLFGVPYRGMAPAMVDLLSGRIDLTMLDGNAALSYASSGKVTILGRVDGIRSSETSQVPTLEEQGADGLTVDTRFAVLTPASASTAVVETLRKLIAGVRKEPGLRAQMEQAGFQAIDEPDDQFVRAAAASVRQYRQLAQSAGLI